MRAAGGASHAKAGPKRGGVAPAHEVPCRHSTGPDGEARLRQAWARPPRTAIFTEPNNNWIGRLYIGTGFGFFLAAGVLALVMRLQLAVPEGAVLDPATYNQFFTMHGTVMMFLFAVPIAEAFAVMLPYPFSWRVGG